MILSSFLLASSLWAAPLSIFEEGSHCVAYKAKKTVFLVSSGTVVGKNCDVSAQVLPEVGGLYHIEVIIPVRSFRSGDVDRDEDVMKALKADVKPEITFRTGAKTAEDWRQLFARNQFDLDGDLTIGEKKFPIHVVSHYDQHDENAEIDGMAKVRFDDFEIDPPTVGLGLIAKTKQDLELHFHLLGSRILGADSIRLEKK